VQVKWVVQPFFRRVPPVFPLPHAVAIVLTDVQDVERGIRRDDIVHRDTSHDFAGRRRHLYHRLMYQFFVHHLGTQGPHELLVLIERYYVVEEAANCPDSPATRVEALQRDTLVERKNHRAVLKDGEPVDELAETGGGVIALNVSLV